MMIKILLLKTTILNTVFEPQKGSGQSLYVVTENKQFW